LNVGIQCFDGDYFTFFAVLSAVGDTESAAAEDLFD
jgi:hypothetical protein